MNNLRSKMFILIQYAKHMCVKMTFPFEKHFRSGALHETIGTVDISSEH